MEQDLRFVMPLLRILNSSEALRMNYRQLCSMLSVSVDQLQNTAMAANSLEPLLRQEGTDLVLKHRLDLIDDKVVFEKITMRGRFALQDVITSTNAELMEEKDYLVSGDALVTEIQTAGRTRRDGLWVTGIGANVMLSMAFRFDSLQQLLGFSPAVGVAVVTALESLGVFGIKLKWPNDLMVEDAKLAGILIDSVHVQDGVFAIVGIGINVHRFAGMNKVDDRKIITLDDMGHSISRNDVCISVINEVKYAAKRFRASGLEPFLDFWYRHDALRGRHVSVAISEHRTLDGRVSGLNSLGELLLESNCGRTAVRSGHIVRIGNANE